MVLYCHRGDNPINYLEATEMKKYIPSILSGALVGQLIALASLSGLAWACIITFALFVLSKDILEK